MKNRFTLVLLLLLVALAVYLRGYRLGVPYFFSDEAFTWRVAESDLPDLLRRCAADTHPPGHFLLLKAWMAIWGSSPAALRSLSVLCGVLCVPTIYLLCIEACEANGPSSERTRLAARYGGLFAAFWTAIHVVQVSPSRTARMYSMGALLAGVSSWLLLRALRAERRQGAWWSAYGVSVAAFCYTHNFALFTVAAQILFVAGDLLRQARVTSRQRATRAALGFGWAGIMAAVLYSPWLPVFLAQAERVQQRFWIRLPTTDTLEKSFVYWCSGASEGGHAAAMVWLAASAGFAAWTVWRLDRGGLFFLVQAAVPWAFTLAISYFHDRPLLQERYLTFAQLSWLALWGIACSRIRGLPERMLLALALVASSAYATAQFIERLPQGASPMQRAVQFLKEHYRSGDVVVTENAAAVHVIRYHAEQAGMTGLDVRCRIDHVRPLGQTVHIAALTADDVGWESDEPPADVRRVWSFSRGAHRVVGAPSTWKEQSRRVFKPSKGFNTGSFVLTLHTR